MKVTEVKVFPVSDEKLKAFVSVVIDHCFMVNDIKVIEGRDGRFISMPSRRKRNGKFKDIAHPLNSETRTMLEQEILSEYARVENGHGPSKSTAAGSPVVNDGGRDGSRGEQPAPAVRAASAETTDDGAVGESSLEEVTEKHLSDSFWTS